MNTYHGKEEQNEMVWGEPEQAPYQQDCIVHTHVNVCLLGLTTYHHCKVVLTTEWLPWLQMS